MSTPTDTGPTMGDAERQARRDFLHFAFQLLEWMDCPELARWHAIVYRCFMKGRSARLTARICQTLGARLVRTDDEPTRSQATP